MEIEFSNIIFTEQDDIVSLFGTEEIFLSNSIVNTLAGNDLIIGNGGDYGFELNGTLYMSDGDDTIIGTGSTYGIFSPAWGNGTLDTGNDNDVITGNGTIWGILNNVSTLNTGAGDDTITGTGGEIGLVNDGDATLNTGDGNDIITGTGAICDILNGGTIDTGNGDDSIICQGTFIHYSKRFSASGSIVLGDGNDSVIANVLENIHNSISTDEGNDIITIASIVNYGGTIGLGGGTIYTGEGEDTITSVSIDNGGTIHTGEGNDIITSTSIGNSGTIDTGNGEDSIISHGNLGNYGGEVLLGEGNDSIIVDVFVNVSITQIDDDGIITRTGVINTGDGNDSIIANGGFESNLNSNSGRLVYSSGSVVLGNGEDYIKGFGSGDFYGGNGNDTLELMSGSYTIGISDTRITFTNGSGFMLTSEFEHLIAGSTIYDFTSLTEGQTIFVA
jgi:hypothetical protein